MSTYAEIEYYRMKCRNCGYEEWAEADIADELATYNPITKKYEVLLECPKCNGTMEWYHKETKKEKIEYPFDIDDLPF